MHRNGVYDKKLGHGLEKFSNMANGGHLEFLDTVCVFE